MKSTTINCSPCKGTGLIPGSKKWSVENSCKLCEGYGYRHPPKGWLKKRTILNGEYFFFLSAWENDPSEGWDQRDYVELNGGGCIYIGDAESYEPSHDRKKNFFFTKQEARKALSKIRMVINNAK